MDDETRDYLTDVHKSVFLDWTQRHTSDLYSVAERRYDSWMRAIKAQIWDEAIDAASEQGTIQIPDNPYRASETA